MLIAKAARLICDSRPYVIEVESGARISRISARTVVIATGAQYRRLSLENLFRFEGAGVYYGATFMEAQLCGGEEVIVVGGGNSAGQAAVFLAQTTKRVHMLVRSTGLDDSMSRYLIRRIENNPTIVFRPQTEIVTLEGGDHLDSVRWRNGQMGQTEQHKISHVFVMTGADPNTRCLDGLVALDDKGFIKTGPDLSPENLTAAAWPLTRQPYLLETSLPGF
jgi:thioredoxin reductase (NADPH)